MASYLSYVRIKAGAYKKMTENKPVYWECINGKHKKFWAAHIIKRKAKYILVRKWGRIGAKPQMMEQEFESERQAEVTLNALVWSKESKGYRPVF